MAEISPLTISPSKSLLNTKSIVMMLLVSVGYLLLSRFMVGYKSDQLFLVVLANALYFASRVSRKLITGFSVFIVYWIIFDYMKAFPNYEYNQVHIGSLYELEKSVFGFTVSGTVVTPNEYWNLYHNSFLDVLSGIFYLTWVPVPMAFAIYLFFRKKDQFVHFCLSFLLINLIGFVVYYIYPAAPPWYVQQHGFEFIANTPGNTGGLSRFDTFFHTPVFSSIYEKSSNVFAAMPSLHSSYPVLVLYYGLKNKLGKINILFTVLMSGIWFSAVYTSHHYVLDVIAGLTCAIAGIAFFKLLNKRGPVKWLSENLVRATT